MRTEDRGSAPSSDRMAGALQGLQFCVPRKFLSKYNNNSIRFKVKTEEEVRGSTSPPLGPHLRRCSIMMGRGIDADDRVGLLFGGCLPGRMCYAKTCFAFFSFAPPPLPLLHLVAASYCGIYCVMCFVSKRMLEPGTMDRWMDGWSVETWSELMGSQKITVIVVVSSVLSACLQSPTHSLAAGLLLLLRMRSEANGVLCWLISITFYTSSFALSGPRNNIISFPFSLYKGDSVLLIYGPQQQ